ncbi:MAG TPA: ABC transporter permease [Streptosporangiaceae bacterium]|nr:ABC transporter permease [Streptosporangiaceae bacterium]
MTAPSSTLAGPAAQRHSAPGSSGVGLGSLAGTGELARFAMRRDRILLVVWIYALTAIAGSGGFGLKLIYKTPADRASLAGAVRSDPALAFIYGQLHGSSLGALAAWRYLAYAALAAALMSIFLVVRHTRADEETGRLELIGSAAVGRNASLAVAMLVASVANIAVCVLTVAVLALSGLPIGGAIAYALAETACGLVFAAIAAISAQISGTARGARGIAITAIAVAFLLRGVGDSGGGHGLSWMTWLSPIGWAELVRPFTGDRWWVLALPVGVTVVGVVTAFVLAARRDQGSGLVQPKPGPADASWALSGPGGLAWRLQRGSIAGWVVGFLLGGLAIGVVGNGIGKLLGSTGAVSKALTEIGGQAALTNAYLAACMSLLGLVAAAYAVSAVLRLRAEEADGRGEPVLVAPVSRQHWGGSHLLVALVGTVAVLVAGAFGMGFGYGASISDLGTQVPRLIGAGLAQVPAALLVAAVAAAFVGLAPRASVPAGWTAVAVCGFIGVFGPALQLSQKVLDISPFTHVPKLPGGTFTATPLVWLSGIAVALAVVCLVGLRHRDIG